MAQADKYSIRNLKQDFPNDGVCLDYLFDNLHTRQCTCGGTYRRLAKRAQFQCSKCRFQIAPMSGTIFEKSSTPLTLWFHAIFIFSNAKSGISAKEMERQLGVTYKTAWRMLALIRKSLGQDKRKLKGDVEMDESWFGGRFRSGKGNKLQSQAIKAKTVITGAVERGGDMRAKVTPDAKAHTAGQFLKENIDPVGTRLMTDTTDRYNRVAVGYARHSVNHSKKEYARGDVHINNMEQFWAHVKRSVRGTHKVISRKHLQSYLDGFVFHYNNRHNDRARFDALLGALVG